MDREEFLENVVTSLFWEVVGAHVEQVNQLLGILLWFKILDYAFTKDGS